MAFFLITNISVTCFARKPQGPAPANGEMYFPCSGFCHGRPTHSRSLPNSGWAKSSGGVCWPHGLGPQSKLLQVLVWLRVLEVATALLRARSRAMVLEVRVVALTPGSTAALRDDPPGAHLATHTGSVANLRRISKREVRMIALTPRVHCCASRRSTRGPLGDAHWERRELE